MCANGGRNVVCAVRLGQIPRAVPSLPNCQLGTGRGVAFLSCSTGWLSRAFRYKLVRNCGRKFQLGTKKRMTSAAPALPLAWYGRRHVGFSVFGFEEFPIDGSRRNGRRFRPEDCVRERKCETRAIPVTRKWWSWLGCSTERYDGPNSLISRCDTWVDRLKRLHSNNLYKVDHRAMLA